MHADLLSWDELIFATELKTEEYLRGLFGLEHEGTISVNNTKETMKVHSGKLQTYVAVDDVHVYVDALRLSGGRVVSAPEQIPGFGHMCEVIDPAGTRVRVIDRREQVEFSN